MIRNQKANYIFNTAFPPPMKFLIHFAPNPFLQPIWFAFNGGGTIHNIS